MDFDNCGSEFHPTAADRFLTDKDVFYILVILALVAVYIVTR